MDSGYGIICDARKGTGLEVKVLALVDRSRSKRLWWTSDDVGSAMCYQKKSAAEFAASRLKMNGARVVSFEYVRSVIQGQRNAISLLEDERDYKEAMDASEAGWDGHKS